MDNDKIVTEDLLEIPEFLKRAPITVEKTEDIPVEIEREFVSVEEEGGTEIVKE